MDKIHENKPLLTYYFDGLCGWCYGFSPVIQQVRKDFEQYFSFEVISGGLFLGHRVGTVNTVAPYIKQGAYKLVEALTGVKFGAAFLKDINEEDRIVLDSLPLAKILCIVKELSPNNAFEFTHTLLSSVYRDGISPIDVNNYVQYVSELGIDKETFLAKMADPKYEVFAKKEFEAFRNSGLGGFPALVLESKGKQTLISSGFTDFDTLTQRLNEVINNI